MTDSLIDQEFWSEVIKSIKVPADQQEPLFYSSHFRAFTNASIHGETSSLRPFG